MNFTFSVNKKRKGISEDGHQLILKEKIERTAFGITEVVFAMTASGRAPQHIGKQHGAFRLVKIGNGSICCRAFIGADQHVQLNAARVDTSESEGFFLDEIIVEEDLELQMAAASAALTIAEGGYFAYPEHQRT